MSSPEKPPEHPDTPTPDAAVHPQHAPNGVPQGTKDEEATGSPNSDRQDSETAAKP